MSGESIPSVENGVAPYIPWDKSWLIRMGVQDLRHGPSDTVEFLEQQREPELGDDLIYLKKASRDWREDRPVRVGESGTLYRQLLFLSWKDGLDKEFITERTLRGRNITLDPSIVGRPQRELLRLDNKTSQWASAAVLCGDTERIDTTGHSKLQLTYDAVDEWQRQQNQDIPWLPRRDETIARQAAVFRKLFRGEVPAFVPLQAEDYCFAVEFGYIRPEEGLRRWPSLSGHESNRPVEMAAAMDQAGDGEIVESQDHRVVQAVAMWGKLMGREVEFEHPDAVSKSWPQFWDFIEDLR